MRIGFFETDSLYRRYIEKNLNSDLYFSSNPLSSSDGDFDIISVFIDSKIDKTALDRMNNLKLIVTRSRGTDHIDMEECEQRNIKVETINYGGTSVAEYTFGLIIIMARNLFSKERRIGFELKNKTIGIIGTGLVGSEVARIANGFGMKILAYDIIQNKELEKHGLRYVSLNELLEYSNIVTIHIPLTKDTKDLINKSNIGLMPYGSILINTSRHGIVNEYALTLFKGVFASDVDAFGDFTTPHNAFNTVEAKERMLKETIKKIKAFKEARNCA